MHVCLYVCCCHKQTLPKLRYREASHMSGGDVSRVNPRRQKSCSFYPHTNLNIPRQIATYIGSITTNIIKHWLDAVLYTWFGFCFAGFSSLYFMLLIRSPRVVNQFQWIRSWFIAVVVWSMCSIDLEYSDQSCKEYDHQWRCYYDELDRKSFFFSPA